MANKIRIIALKGIKSLTFEIPKQGVYLLSGTNGAGKTSVLACLRRIGFGNSFAHHFASSGRSKLLDSFEDTSITYEVNDQKLAYSYKGTRWVGAPRSNVKILDQLGYPDVIYVGATADRITPRPEDFAPRRAKIAEQDLRDVANLIFSTTKFDNLRIVNVTRGNGNQAFVLQVNNNPAKYISEKNFSLGELCVLKLIKSLKDCKNNSLILIDELELALHPSAQQLLYVYLEEIAEKKSLTVVFSTHSVSLLKHVPRSKILFLENIDGEVFTIKSCFPTYAIGNIALGEERTPDGVIFVEDEAAIYVTEALLRLVIAAKFNEKTLFPTINVLPIGPFTSVVNFLPRSRGMLPANCTSVALLDDDVKTETLVSWKATNAHAELAKFQRHKNEIHYLPWTPERALVEYIQRPEAQAQIRSHYSDHRITLQPAHIVVPAAGATGGEIRRAAKQSKQQVLTHLLTYRGNETPASIEKALFELVAKWHFASNRDATMALFAPMVSGQRQ